MHPNPAFGIDCDAALEIARAVAFAHVLVVAGGVPFVVHAPVTVVAADLLDFHMAVRNRATPLPAGVRAVASIAGDHGYVSPDWYASEQQVPTWNYVAVEAEGTLSPLDRAGLVAHLDQLSAEHEARLAPKPAWTRAKMEPARFDAMTGAIRGYRLHVASWRGTAKLSQNRRAADVAGVVAGLHAAGHPRLAEAVADAGRGPA